MTRNRFSHSLPIVQAMRRVRQLVHPLQVSVRYHGENQVTLTLPTYPGRNGELRIIDLGPGKGRGLRVRANGTFKQYARTARKAVATIQAERNGRGQQ